MIIASILLLSERFSQFSTKKERPLWLSLVDIPYFLLI